MDSDNNCTRLHRSTGNMPHKPAQKEAQPLTSPASRKSPSFSPNQVSILSCLTDEFNVHQYPITTDCEIYHLINILNTGRQECSEEGEKTFVAIKAASILAELCALIENIALFSENVNVSQVEWPCFAKGIRIGTKWPTLHQKNSGAFVNKIS